MLPPIFLSIYNLTDTCYLSDLFPFLYYMKIFQSCQVDAI